MAHRRLTFSLAIADALLLLAFTSPLRAENLSQETIPVGTKITTANWQQYQQFMPEGLKALFGGVPSWRLPTDTSLEVGPTISIPMPDYYKKATEKYGGQTHLERFSTGGYVPKGYVAGLPFPNPLVGDPALTGQRIFWNSWYHFEPRGSGGTSCTYVKDSYGNITDSADVIFIYSYLSHVTEQGFPMTIPGSNGYYFVSYAQQYNPEQGKYLTSLDLLPDDSTLLPELYEYVPTLRRSLRLSQAARCAPLFGSDYTTDDLTGGPPGLPQLFKIDYLGEKKIVALVHQNREALKSCGGSIRPNPSYYSSEGKGVSIFWNAGSGKWELRDVYVLSVQRLPEYRGGYCYGKKIIYVDKENYTPLANDVYDAAGKMYKYLSASFYPTPVPTVNGGGEALNIDSSNAFLVANFQDTHITFLVEPETCVDAECTKTGYLDVSRYASPDGLMKIGQ